MSFLNRKIILQKITFQKGSDVSVETGLAVNSNCFVAQCYLSILSCKKHYNKYENIECCVLLLYLSKGLYLDKGYGGSRDSSFSGMNCMILKCWQWYVWGILLYTRDTECINCLHCVIKGQPSCLRSLK